MFVTAVYTKPIVEPTIPQNKGDHEKEDEMPSAARNSIISVILYLVTLSYATDPTTNIQSDCKYKLDSTSGTFSTPNYPSNYPNNKKCGWTIETTGNAADIKVTFHDFVLEPSKRCSFFDYVMIYTQEFGSNDWNQMPPATGQCGTETSFWKFQSCKRMLVKFVSDDKQAFKGFNASYEVTVTQVTPRIQCLGKYGDAKCNRTVTTIEKSEVKLECKATGNPPPVYNWLMENETGSKNFIPVSGSRFYAALSGVLTIRDLKKTDEKKYQCVATNKHGNNKSECYVDVKTKCVCPKVITTNAYSYSPYTRYIAKSDPSTGKIEYKGILYAIISKMVQRCCGNCSDGHGPSSIKWEDINVVQKKSMVEMKDKIETNNYHISYPVRGLGTSQYYGTNTWFVPVIDTPGTALLVKVVDGTDSSVIFTSILGGWPILVLTIVMAVLAGIIIWMLDTYWNEEQFPRSFTEGVVEGFWWAFVTMTTVGYGDIAPVGIPARLFAIVWVLTGLVIISIFTGVITTALTVSTLNTSVKLYGTKVGAIQNTSEFYYGVKRNSNMTAFKDYDQMGASLQSKTINAILIDAYVAANRPSLSDSKKTRVNKIIKDSYSYGFVVPNGKGITASAIQCFRNYVEQQKQSISEDVAQNTLTLQESATSAAADNAAALFNPKSKLFLNAVIVSMSLLVLFSILGLLFEYCYLRPKHLMLQAARNLEMVETPEIREMAKRAQLMKEILLAEIKEFHERWKDNVVNLRQKHQEQQKEFLNRGNNKTKTVPAKEAIEMESTSRAGSRQAFVDKKEGL